MSRKSIFFSISLLLNLVLATALIQAVIGNTDKYSSHYPYLAKRIFVDNPNDIFINFVPLRKSLEARLNQIDAPKSFYFEYLPDGTSIRLGDDTELIAASLTKLPIVMDLYRAAELGRVNLDQQVEITKNEIDSAFGNLWKKGPGARITLRQAAELTLKESDNTAKKVIAKAVHADKKLQTDEESFAQLDIDYSLKEGVAVISAKSFASMLKCLYFACYLTRPHSQELLNYLSQSTYTQRITRDLPKDIPVAHKIGVLPQKLSESDCGIVYVPKRPYLLCIMVGLPAKEADGLMAELSKEIYNFVSQQKL